MKEITSGQFSFEPFEKLKKEWALVSAGTEDAFNTMTVNWGGFGELWFKSVATIYIRPSRYTHEFLDAQDYFSICFLKPGNEAALKLCGAQSGRDGDKTAKAGLTPIFPDGIPAFSQAEYILLCKKLYAQEIRRECFCDSSVFDASYANGDCHTMYIGEVVKVLENR
jgi:flavin reductase (DIM6/NTAB) family NADH-FMN oxidoreductase RutF